MRNFILLLALLAFFSSCSPLYVMQASLEQSRILLGREKISSIIQQDKTSEEEKTKLKLVLKAREFSKELGLDAKDSFTTYGRVDRDVLVWVLTASEKTKLKPYTWWFPIVGSVPYKGFFSKEKALAELNKLKNKGYDVYLRPSQAYSTLGWFNDPLLSTTLAYDEASLLNTVFHELTHNTVWIKNNVSFNETLAHVVGSLANIEFYRNKLNDKTKSEKETDKLKSDLLFAEHLKILKEDLDSIYSSDLSLEDKLGLREEIFKNAASKWSANKGENASKYNKLTGQLNNAVIIALSTYLDRPELFIELHEHCGKRINCLIAKIEQVKPKSSEDPYEILRNQLDEDGIKK